MTYDVALIYPGEDRSLAQWIVEALSKRNLAIWWDENLPPGREFSLDYMANVMLSSRHVVLLWSMHSSASDWVHAELELAQRLRVPVIPCLEGHAPRLPTWLLDRVAVDFRGDRLVALERLVGVIGGREMSRTASLPFEARLPILAAAFLVLTIALLPAVLGPGLSSLRMPLSMVVSWLLSLATTALLPVIALSLVLSLVRVALEYMAAWRLTRALGSPPAAD
jgi:hypothetical protein